MVNSYKADVAPLLNKKIKVLLIAASVWWFAEGMLGPVFAVFTEMVGGDIFEITLAWSIYLISMGALTFVFGRYSDRFGKEKMLITGYALNCMFTFGYLFVSGPVDLFFVQAGLGIAAALATPTWDALYSRYEDKKRRGAQWGFADGLEKILPGIAIVVGGMIVVNFSFTVLFVIMGTMQAVATVCQTAILMKNKKTGKSRRR